MITDPLKEIKMVKTDPKKVPNQNFFLLIHQGTIAQLFTKRKFPLHNPFKVLIYSICPLNFPDLILKSKEIGQIE